MLVRHGKIGGLLVTLCLLLAAGAAWDANGRGLPVQEGILNFGKISDNLYRGAQPDAAALKSLQKLGIKTIINLRMPDDAWKAEETEARTRGILYTNVPFQGLGRPTDAQVSQVLGMIESLPGPVFIHCQHGCDRTGTIIACYRIKHDLWPHEQALKEAKRYGLSRFERGMNKYVLAFAKPPNARENRGFLRTLF
jgi:protein tyrosine/serine phosphatase